MMKTWAALACVGLSVTHIAQVPDARQALIARAKSLELNTTCVPPPGDPLEHHASGYAKINGDGTFPAPKEAFDMAGVGGQTVLMVPSHQLAIVRLGRAEPGGRTPQSGRYFDGHYSAA